MVWHMWIYFNLHCCTNWLCSLKRNFWLNDNCYPTNEAMSLFFQWVETFFIQLAPVSMAPYSSSSASCRCCPRSCRCSRSSIYTLGLGLGFVTLGTSRILLLKFSANTGEFVALKQHVSFPQPVRLHECHQEDVENTENDTIKIFFLVCCQQVSSVFNHREQVWLPSCFGKSFGRGHQASVLFSHVREGNHSRWVWWQFVVLKSCTIFTVSFFSFAMKPVDVYPALQLRLSKNIAHFLDDVP